MSTPMLWRALARHETFGIRQRPSTLRFLPTHSRSSSLSAIHRGLRRSRTTADRLERKHAKVTRKKAAEAEEGSGRPSRRKRFHDPESSFGKKSLVYRLKFGDLKDAVPASTDERESSTLRSRRPARAREPSTGVARRPARFDVELSGGRPSRRRPAREPRARGVSRPDEGTLVDIEPRSPTKPAAGVPPSVAYTTASSQFLYGASVVTAALNARRRRFYNLYLAEGSRLEAGPIRSLAAKQRVPVTVVPKDEQSMMDKMSKGRPHNGVILETSPLPQPALDALGACDPTGFHVQVGWQSKEDQSVSGTASFWKIKAKPGRQPFVLLLHEILDPGNMGSILRTARFLGVSAVGVTLPGSTAMTPVVLKAAAGASEELQLFSVRSPENFLKKSQEAGWVSYAACPPFRVRNGQYLSTGKIMQQNPLADAPAILVLGNEGSGLPTSVIRAADHAVSIPAMTSDTTVDSLNVSVATGLLCHAFLQQPEKSDGRPVSRTPIRPTRHDLADLRSGLAAQEASETFAEEEKRDKLW